MPVPPALEMLNCDNCGEPTTADDLAECSVCHKSACVHGCIVVCDCGCERKAHRGCMVAWERDAHTASWRYWGRECLLDHAVKCEVEAAEYMVEAERAKQAAKRVA